MKQRLIVLAAVMIMAAATMGSAVAQEADDLPLRVEDTDTSNHPDVLMIVSVPPEMVGKGLTSDDFTVTESGDIRPVEATAVPTDGLQVVLLLDASGSMRGEPIVAARAAALSFLDSMPAGVEVAVVSFANTAEVLSPFSTDVEETAAAIANLSLGGETALYDGLLAGAGLFEGTTGARRTIVLLSDGGDTASAATLDGAISSVLDAEVGFYAVELQSPEYDAVALARLGGATDGIVVAAEDPDGLSTVFLSVASQIVNRYELQYVSEAHGRTAVGVKAEVDGLVASGLQSVTYPVVQPSPAEPTDTVPAPVADVVDTPAPLRTGAIVVLDWWQSSNALRAGAIAVFIAIAALLIFTGVTEPKERRPAQVDKERSFGKSKGKVLSSLADQATLLAERTINRGGDGAGRMTNLLEKAGLQLRPGEMIVMAMAASLAVAAVTMLVANALLAVALGLFTLLLIRGWIGRRITVRQSAFAEQLPDILLLMSGSIRSGFGLMQAMDTVAQEMPAPAGEEFQRVKVETQLGRDINEALLAMSARLDSEDFKWVIEAVDIHREVGGDLAEILDSVMGTVRDRIRINRRIRTLSAEGRMSGVVLALLPVVLAVVMFALNPDYMALLFTTTIGNLLLAAGVILMLIGALWMRSITSLKF